MRIERIYTQAGKDPLAGITWEERISEIKNPDGSSVFRQEKVRVPSFWSQVATDILAQKYFRRAGVPEIGCETDSRQVFHRLAGCWAAWGRKGGYFDSEEDAQAFYDEMLFMLAHQVGSPNSPQWFNTGLHWAYGIQGDASGQWYYDPEKKEVVQAQNSYERPQAMACFIQPVKDDLVNEGGIMDLWEKEARIFKFGGGAGSNVSNLRAEGEPLSGGGKSSGLMSFLRIGDVAAGSIKSGGTSRRAALMRIVDLDHPDVDKFIGWKTREEYKVAAMAAGSRAIRTAIQNLSDAAKDGSDPSKNKSLRKALASAKKAGVPPQYLKRILSLLKQDIPLPLPDEIDTDWQGEGYQTVSGQNSNNSIRIPNEFFRRLANGGMWEMKSRTSGKVTKTVEAEALWDKIARAAWECADPGIQFDDTINEWHTHPSGGKINGSNPCSEFFAVDNTACNLASLNLLKFYDKGVFKAREYLHAVRLWTLALEITVSMAAFPSKEIALNTYNYRLLGLGYANLGALLMCMGFPYDSKEARAVAGAITAILTGEAYHTSALIAKDVGAFTKFQEDQEAMLRVIRNHHAASTGRKSADQYKGLSVLPVPLDHSIPVCKPLVDIAVGAWTSALQAGKKHGFRNAQLSVLAPTGTIGLVMDCDTTGVEPDYALVKSKKLAGGGYLKIINGSVPKALSLLGYGEGQVRDIIDYATGHPHMDTLSAELHNILIHRTSLSNKGVTPQMLAKIEEVLPQVFDLKSAFMRAGTDLSSFGFSDADVEKANKYYCGAMTVEGAPHLKPEHYPVFACATKCGKSGVQFIPHMAHVEMVAAVQPFLTGSASKTVNIPSEATVGDVKIIYKRAWELGLKAVALYRDASKLSQPLSGGAEWDVDEEEEAPSPAAEVQAQKNVTDMFRTRRRRLPGRRRGYTQKASVGGNKVYVRTGEYEDGTLGEIFLDMHREGAAFRSLMNSFAIAISLGLQHGVPLQEFVDAFVFTKFEPGGVVSGHDNIKFATSVLDYIFRDLALTYMGRKDLVQVPPAEGESNSFKSQVYDLVDDAKAKGYTGDVCGDCGSGMMTRNGTCLKCQSCGSTTGCS